MNAMQSSLVFFFEVINSETEYILEIIYTLKKSYKISDKIDVSGFRTRVFCFVLCLFIYINKSISVVASNAAAAPLMTLPPVLVNILPRGLANNRKFFANYGARTNDRSNTACTFSFFIAVFIQFCFLSTCTYEFYSLLLFSELALLYIAHLIFYLLQF